MTLEEWELDVQVESPVEFLSLAHHGCDLRDVYQAQGLMDYFGMLSGPTYLTLVRYFLGESSTLRSEGSSTGIGRKGSD